jgi:hypothetical protein
MHQPFQIFTLTQKPQLEDEIERLSMQAWPVFLRQGGIPHWGTLFDVFAPYQLLFCDDNDHLIAVGHTVPTVWDGTPGDLPPTMDEIIVRGLRARETHPAPNVLSAMAAMINPEQRSAGLSIEVVKAMRSLAAQHGLSALIAPVRPPLKARYPLTPFERYVHWQRADGSPFDPWLRVHWRLGAQSLAIAPNTLTITGTVAEWELWTKLAFPESGDYVVDGALQPVHIDLDKNEGRYEDPNLWMRHPVD